MPDNDAPKPGHFLPGGAGADSSGVRKPVVPGDSTPLTAPTPRLGGSTPAGPPQLSGSRLGPPPPGDPAAGAFKARYQPEPIPFVEKKRSKVLVAAIVAGVVLVAGAGVAGATKLLSKYDDFVANPIGTTPSLPGGTPSKSEPTGTPTPDPVVEKENKLYANGRLASVRCKEPAFRPTSKENVRSYYEVLLKCLNQSWKPVVEKAGFTFHEPRLIIFDEGEETACGVQKLVASYCDAEGGAVTMPWQDLVESYEKNKALARIDEPDALGYVYAVHVQKLTGIFDASDNLSDTAPTDGARLEHQRRQALQATCLAGAFFGAEKATFPIQGELLKQWQWRSRNDGDEQSEDKVRDHGSRKSAELWRTRGFSTADPGSCNTFVAAADKVG
ncbi:neutral zinc metallopeptidase [Kribbella monticola]|uniref:neutral zinc metallopeptidase n=1 Tax=Kribbella monticola TaxID=2185285 RepID=UPI000DD37642|nr:neutral zinc metallopeptidase [Kribbella monticola]